MNGSLNYFHVIELVKLSTKNIKSCIAKNMIIYIETA